MSETMEIPDDIREWFINRVASAILAERERTIEECAKLAEGPNEWPEGLGIADAIRSLKL